jgi:hypothetical protein
VTAAGDWPHTTRLLPWSLAVFLVVVFLVPSEAVHLNVPLPVDPTPDRFLLAGIALLLAISMVMSRARFAPGRPASGFSWAALLFFLVALISVAANATHLVRIGDFEQSIRQLALLAFNGVLFYAVAVTLRPTELRAFATLMVVLAVLMATGTLWEYRTTTNIFYDTAAKVFGPVASVAGPGSSFGIDGRVTTMGPTQSGLVLTSMVAVMLPFTLLGLLSARNYWRKALYVIAVGLLFAACVATFKKASFVAPLVAVATLAVYRPKQVARLAPLLLVILVLSHGLAPGALGSVTAQFTNGFFTAGTTVGRTSDYQAISSDLATYPLTGRGYGSITPKKPDYYRVLDNQYLGQLVTLGFVGLASYAFMMFSAMRLAHPVARRAFTDETGRIGLAAMAGFVAFTVSAFLYDLFSYWEVAYLFFFIAGMCSVAASTPAPATAPAPSRAPVQRSWQPSAGGVTAPGRGEHSCAG